MLRTVFRNLMIATLIIAVAVQFDTPVRTVLIAAADRVSLIFTGSSLGYGG